MSKAESKRTKRKSSGSRTPPEIEERPDGWARFERAVDAAVKSGRISHKPKKRADALARKRAFKSESIR
jgi:hypothetical protein